MDFRVSAAAMAVAAALSSAPAGAETFTATVVAGHPPVFRWVRMFPESFFPAVEAALEGSGHSISFSPQFGGAIAGVGEELEAVEAGLAEIGVCQSLFDPAKLAPQNVTYYTPLVSDDVAAVTRVMEAMQDENAAMQQAWADNGVVYLGASTAVDDYMLMTNFPVNSLADLEGHKIAAPGAAGNWLSGTGATPVAGNLTTYYNEIKTGVYDGTIVFASAALPGKLYEVAPYILKAGLGAQYAGGVCANKDWYDGLPTEVQAALQGAADTATAWYVGDLENAVAVSLAKMAEAGATITEASPEMRQAWAAGMNNAAREWATQLDGQGKDGTAVLSDYMDRMRAAGATPVRNWDKE